VLLAFLYVVALICDVVLDPNFVSSFVYNDKVYFFFREMAIENINCGKVSTVCRLHCALKSDKVVQLTLVRVTTAEK